MQYKLKQYSDWYIFASAKLTSQYSLVVSLLRKYSQ